MRPRALSFVIFASCIFAAKVTAAPPQTSPPAAPASTTASAQTPSTNGASAASTEQAAKKVWTNEDLRVLHDDAPDSAVVDRKPEPSGTRPRNPYPKGRNAKWYHDQIAALQARIPKLDSQIAQLQAAIDGKPTGNGKTSERPWVVRSDDWSAELKQLQAQRADLMSKISALEDEARHNGIPVSSLP